MDIFTTNTSNEAANQAWLANLKATRPDAYAAYMRLLQLTTAKFNDPDEGGSATRSARLRMRQQIGYSEQALEEARQNIETNYPEVAEYSRSHGQSTGGLGQGGDELVAAVALPAAAAYMAPTVAGTEAGAGAGVGAEAGTGLTETSLGTGVELGTTPTWESVYGAGSEPGASSLLGSLVGSGGSNIPAWLGLFGNIWAANQMGGGENAEAADPFASQRPYYQEMLRNLLENPASFQETPMFQTALETGAQAIDRSASARGLLGSGARLAELEKYGVGLANQNFMQYLNALTPLTGATTGSPAAAAGLGQEAQINQTNAYLQALRSASPLLMQFATWGQGD